MALGQTKGDIQMKKFILALILGTFLTVVTGMVAHAGGFKFNDFNMAKMSQYSHSTAFSVSGPNRLVINGAINPIVAYESDSIPTLALLSPGAGMAIDMGGAGKQGGAAVVDFVHFGWLNFGAYKLTDDFNDNKFFDAWKFKIGVGGSF